MSISASLSSFEWDDRKINLIDTPGEPSFVADALGALRVCESAVFVVNAVMGVEVTTARLWERAAELDLARMVFVNMLDRERADFFRTLESLKAAFGPHVVATEIPIGTEHDVRGVIDLVDMKAYEYDGDARDNCREIPIPDELSAQAEEYREKLMDEVAEVSDALMERYLEGEEISHEEIVTALKDGTNHGGIFPVICGVATRNLGHEPAARRDRRGPAVAGEARRPRAAARSRSSPTDDKELFAYVFKTRADPFAGRINLFRVYQGAMRHDTPGAQHPRARQGAHRPAARAPGQGAGPRRRVRPRRHRRRRQAQGDARRRLAGRARRADRDAGDQAARAGHGLRDRGRRATRTRSSPRCAACRRRTRRSTCTATPQTGEQIVAGLSQMHVEVIVDRLKRRFGAEVDAQAAARALPGDDPQSRPRPTGATRSRPAAAASSATATSRSSRWRERPGQFEFVNEIKGGVIPHGLHPGGARRACEDAMAHGAVAGFPVKGVRVRAASTAATTRSTPPRWRSRSPARSR